jgi:hypothetical protein
VPAIDLGVTPADRIETATLTPASSDGHNEREMWSVVTEHAFMSALLAVSVLETAFVGYLAYKAYRSGQQIEGLTAATYLEARKALTQQQR